jgi:hypothetical protein
MLINILVKRNQIFYFDLFFGLFWPILAAFGLSILLMFKNTFHESGFLSLYYSLGSNPLQLWDTHTGPQGTIKEVIDEEIHSRCLEIASENISNCYVICPGVRDRTLGIRLPYFQMVVKNLSNYFSFEIELLDDKNNVRRFRASNFQTSTRCLEYICVLPLRMEEGWNILQFNLAELVKTVYGVQFSEVLRITINANCRLRLVYFADNLYSQDQLPPELKLFIPK